MRIVPFITASMRFTIVAVAALLLGGCGGNADDEPVSPPTPDEIEYQPLSGLNPAVPLLNGYDHIVGYELWTAEKIPDADLTGEGFSFDYWAEHKHEAHSLKELMALCEVPQPLLSAMSTRNLVQTCFVHPYNSIYNAYDIEYLGIMNAMRANCWQELMRRATGSSQLLDLYCELSYPLSPDTDFHDWLSYLDYKSLAADQWNTLAALTLVMMTAVDSNAFTAVQLTRIAGEVFNKIDNLLSADEGSYSYTGQIRYQYLLGAFIVYRYDRSLTPLELSLLYDYTGYQGIPGVINDRLFTAQHASSAMQVVQQHLETIEQGSLLAPTSGIH